MKTQGKEGRRRRRVAFIALFTVALTVAGISFAAWLTTGTGSVKAQAGTEQALTFNAVGTVTNELYPLSSGDVVFDVVNPNPTDMEFLTLVQTGDAVVSGAAGPGCTDANNTVTLDAGVVSAWIGGQTIPGGATTSFTIPNGALMGDSPNDCQGATLAIPVSATADTNV